MPACIPVAIKTAATLAESARRFFYNLTIELDACRVGAENKTVLSVLEAIQNQPKTVRIIQRRVATAIRNNNFRRIIVEADHPDKQRLVCEADIYRSSLSRRAPFVGSDLPKAGGRLDAAPGSIVGNVSVQKRWCR